MFPRKELPENKIDAALGAIMALGHQMLSEEDLPTIYKDEMLLVFWGLTRPGL